MNRRPLPTWAKNSLALSPPPDTSRAPCVINGHHAAPGRPDASREDAGAPSGCRGLDSYKAGGFGALASSSGKGIESLIPVFDPLLFRVYAYSLCAF